LPQRIAYILAEFPSLSETFILREILELQRQGVDLRLFALREGKSAVVHPEAAALRPQVCYRPPFWDGRPWRALGRFVRRRPAALLRLAAMVVRGSWRQPKLLLSRLAHFLTAAYFAEHVEALGVTHLHAHFAFIPTLVALLIGELLNRPFSFTAHAWDLYCETGLLRDQIARAAFVVTCNDYNRRHLERTYPDVAPGKVVRVYHGLDLGEWRIENGKWKMELPTSDLRLPISHLPSPISGQRPVLLSVGRLQRKKGFDVLLRACGHLREQGRAFQLVIVGEGPERKPLQQLAEELCLTPAVTFAGELSQGDVRLLYRAARVFVLPCLITPEGDRDTLPNVILEALAMGTPVVSTPVAGIPEVIEPHRTGLLAPPGDTAALAAQIARLLDDEALGARLAEQGRARVRAQFDLSRNVAALRRLFEQGIGDR